MRGKTLQIAAVRRLRRERDFYLRLLDLAQSEDVHGLVDEALDLMVSHSGASTVTWNSTAPESSTGRPYGRPAPTTWRENSSRSSVRRCRPGSSRLRWHPARSWRPIRPSTIPALPRWTRSSSRPSTRSCVCPCAFGTKFTAFSTSSATGKAESSTTPPRKWRSASQTMWPGSHSGFASWHHRQGMIRPNLSASGSSSTRHRWAQ